MSNISTWDGDTAANNDQAPPDGFPEGQAPSTLNNAQREVMRAVRHQFEQGMWFDWGDVPTQTGATTFTIPGDVTGRYTVGRRLRLTDSSTLYGTITVSAYTTLTTITVSLDSGSLSASLSAVEVSAVDPTNDPLNVTKLVYSGSTKAEATTNGLDVTGRLDTTTFATVGTYATIGTYLTVGTYIEASGYIQSISTDAGATADPVISTFRDSASPAASDEIGYLSFDGNNNAGTPEQTEYVHIGATISDVTDGSEDGIGYLSAMVAGTQTKAMHWAQGLYSPGANGGDQGPDTLNISEYYRNGKMVSDTVLLFEETGSSVTDFEVIDSDGLATGYDWFEWHIECYPATDDCNGRVRTSADSGSTYDSGAGDYSYVGHCQQGNATYGYGTGSQTYMDVSYTSAGNQQSNVTTEPPLRLVIAFRDPSLSSTWFGIVFDGSGCRSTTPEHQRHRGSGARESAAAVSGMQFYFDTGNVASYTQRLYGIKRT